MNNLTPLLEYEKWILGLYSDYTDVIMAMSSIA